MDAHSSYRLLPISTPAGFADLILYIEQTGLLKEWNEYAQALARWHKSTNHFFLLAQDLKPDKSAIRPTHAVLITSPAKDRAYICGTASLYNDFITDVVFFDPSKDATYIIGQDNVPHLHINDRGFLNATVLYSQNLATENMPRPPYERWGYTVAEGRIKERKFRNPPRPS